MTTRLVTRGALTIAADRCKGCELCIDACKPRVLTMTETQRNSIGYLYPELSPGCTACHACAQICPDFVFQVWKYDEPVNEAQEDVA